MKTSERGLALLRKVEGLRLEAYPDPATGAQPWTIGYGRAHGVKPGQTITQEQAEQYLREDVARFEAGVISIAGACTQGQFDALVSFAYNLGLGNLMSSTLLKRHKAGDFTRAGDEFLKWNRGNGRVMPGLTRRRAAERALYLS